MGFWTIALLVVVFAVFCGLTMPLGYIGARRLTRGARESRKAVEEGRKFARYRHSAKWREDQKVSTPCLGKPYCMGKRSHTIYEHHHKDCRLPNRRYENEPHPLISYQLLKAQDLEVSTKDFTKDQLATFQQAFEEHYAVLMDRSKVVANMQHSVARMERELKHTEDAYKEMT